MPVRDPGAWAGFCGPWGFWRADGAAAACFDFGIEPYFSSNCWVELYLVASLRLSIVSSRSFDKLLM